MRHTKGHKRTAWFYVDRWYLTTVHDRDAPAFVTIPIKQLKLAIQQVEKETRHAR